MLNKSKKIQKYSGVLGIIILWASVVTGMFRAHLGLVDARPISYLGVNPSSRLLFSGGLIISSLLFITFAYYVRREFKVKNRFLFYFLVGQTGQIIAAIFPYGSQSTYKLVHTYAAFTLAFSLPLLINQFAISQAKSKQHHVYIRLLRFEQVSFVVGIGMFVLTKGLAPLGEALPAVGFHLWIIALTIIAVRDKAKA